MAAHYNVGVVPARPRKPKDKAAVEAGVRFAQSYILGRLRNVTFFSLAECQAAIGVALERMNGREMRRLGVSRRQLFETIERPVMQDLPEQDYEYAEWHFARVGIDYHVEVAGFLYSVPHTLIREQVDTRATTRTIEIFHRANRVASHARRYGGPRHGTLPDHIPPLVFQPLRGRNLDQLRPVRTDAMANGRLNGSPARRVTSVPRPRR